MGIIKTLTNSWCTSSRFHEEKRLECIFGCEDRDDSLEHYLDCGVLWPIITSCARLGKEWLEVGTAMKLGLQNPTKILVSLTMVAHRVYHKMRFQYTSVILEARRQWPSRCVN